MVSWRFDGTTDALDQRSTYKVYDPRQMFTPWKIIGQDLLGVGPHKTRFMFTITSVRSTIPPYFLLFHEIVFHDSFVKATLLKTGFKSHLIFHWLSSSPRFVILASWFGTKLTTIYCWYLRRLKARRLGKEATKIILKLSVLC